MPATGRGVGCRAQPGLGLWQQRTKCGGNLPATSGRLIVRVWSGVARLNNGPFLQFAKRASGRSSM